MTYETLYRNSLQDPSSFWLDQANMIPWYKAPEQAVSKDEAGFDRWFSDGQINTCYIALDHQVASGRGDQVALYYDSPVTGAFTSITYRALLQETALFAGVLKELGVEKGDRVVIYMPMIPQVVVAMLACARIGAVHSVVFGGFAAHELALRIDDARPKVLLTASAGVEFTKIIPYQPIVEAALAEAKHPIEHLVMYQRWMKTADMSNGRFKDWTSLSQQASPADCVPLAATDPLYILYTSGTTGKPKGIVRDHGGHAVALQFSMKYIYDAAPGDVFWAASDVGWVVGHSYIVYAPLMRGCSSVLYEGKPVRTPDAGAYWRVISDYRVNILFTAPTGFRAVKKEDPEGLLKSKYDVSSLKYLFLAGERCDAATLEWASQLLKIPVIDHWWQTESGWPMLANPAGLELFPVKPGSAGKSVPGYQVCILNEEGQEVPDGTEGAVAIRLPLPPGCLPSLWENPERFRAGYLDPFPGYYFSGDGGFKDSEGYVYISGRIDDVMNVAGHRLSTSEMEEIVAAHPAVAECAVIGVEDELKGQVPVGFVVFKTGVNQHESDIEKDLIQMVRDQIGAVACFRRAVEAKRLPKTRSGKILRKIMRHIADGKSFVPPSTIEDPQVLEELSELMRTKQIGRAFSADPV
jgi:acyl-coenzyme A synthetase/AMP-(fatty) acid ligase